ncbi:hypothetical protein H6G89_09730 [Oscillatoria sp. FACHB-1407]|uniref:hypothetical protein n=1 Tax=Oscillatoria sp. FACHB-1407 TaxID=2692847 RepID=UPI0016861E7B|nr:hypothetical protein [Oscillatoria sp. FACHB-1407]MBD2461326.1 hypothetical protein [Oscillatoria sp. FACHB-1407]
MNTSNLGVSVCRHCQYYRAEGRRGGYCQQLCAGVQGTWKACSLAIPPFAPTWEAIPGIIAWRNQMQHSAEHQLDLLSKDVEPAVETVKVAIDGDI